MRAIYESISRRAGELFAAHQRSIYRRTDSLFAPLLVFQWVAGIAVALWISPRAWAGTVSTIHPHIWASIFLGAVISLFPAVMAWKYPGETLTRHTVAVAQMLSGALLIHLTGGRIETHFHVFGSLAFLAFYRDWRVLLTASIVVFVDHFARGIFWPESVFGVASAPVWRALEHAGWVAFEDFFLIIAIRQSLQEMRRIAGDQAELENSNRKIEMLVAHRTAQLSESEERFRQLSATAPIAIYQTDAEGKWIYANSRWTEISGLSEQGSLQTGWIQAVRPEDRDFVLSEWQVAMEGRGIFECEYCIVRSPAEVRWVHSRARAMCSTQGRFLGYVGMTEDITDRKSSEADLSKARDAALESARLKSEFLANMSHEIRTPMNAVLGMTHLLLDSGLNPEQREFAKTVVMSAESLLTILNDILDFSKIEAGRLSFESLDFDIRETLEDTLELLAESAQAKGVELVGFVQPGTPVHLHGDAGRLRQVLVNLVGNAVKFTHHGEVAVRISRVSDNGDTVELRFEVQDTGIGIAPDVQEQLFEAFIQADGSVTRRYGGTGLGLAISRRLVNMMDGRIGVESEPGRGSTFWFHIRLGRARALPPSAQPRLESLVNLNVLVVDDNATNRLMLHYQLSEWHMRDSHASTADEALDMLRSAALSGNPFHVAILDMQMPDKDGLTLARIMHEDPLLSSVRKIFLTSLGTRISSQLLEEAGVADCLLKPVKQARLFDCLARALTGVLPGPSEKILTEPGVQPPGFKLKILLAEDNHVNQKVVILMLKKLGYDAQVAANGLEALQAVRRDRYDVIFMDCQMPEMEGYEASRLIRKLEGEKEESRRVHIVALTASAMPGDREKCLAAGMNDYLSKPVRIQDLADALADVALEKERCDRLDPPSDAAALSVE